MATINPFQGPINYSVDVQSPFEAALGGFKLGAAGAEIQAQQKKNELEIKAAQQAQQRQTELADLFKNPNATSADYARVVAFLPKDQATIVTQGFERKTKEQQDNDLRMGGQVYSAIKSGQPNIAIQMLTDQAAALRNSGRENEAKAAEASAQAIELNPTMAQATVGLYMATLPGGTGFLEAADKALATIRAEAKAPSELKTSVANADKAVSDADKALSDAITAQETARNAPEKAKADAAKATADALKAKADAQKAEVDAKYAEEITLADLKKKAADLGLTSAQTGSALAQTRKLGVETKKAVLELEAYKASGGIDPAKAFDQEEKLRKEFQLRSKVYGELGTTFSNIKSSANAKTGPGDIALITGFMKMLDPGSVVRETEFATARDTAGLYTRLENSLKKAESGQFLQPNQREEFVNLAKQYLDSAQKKAGDDKKALSVVVKNYKLNPENVFGPEVTGGGGRGVVNPPTPGQINVTVDY
jgi:hypothetical protein